MTQPAAKAAWRARLLTARRARPAPERAAAQAVNADHLLAALRELGGGRRLTVCLYLPLPSEPLAAGAPYLVAARGHRVLVPVTTSGQPLDWCVLPVAAGGRMVGAAPDSTDAAVDAGDVHDAALVPGPLGVLEPAGPRLGPAALLGADVAVVPALATDPAGFRLGRGGGFYDRTLALLPGSAPEPDLAGAGAARAAGTGPHEGGVIPGVPRIAVLFDGETDLPIPHEPHDARVSHVLTPARGLRRIG
jgi:5-formyltetrahydrofolate cyclo-ligase